MSFSVLLSVYHKESPIFLKESLDSIFNQTLPPDEVVLVEDGALTPELYCVVEDFAALYPQLRVVALKENGGLGKALNEGLKHCSHDLVARMDTDDLCKPERFARQVAFMESHPEIDVVGAWVDEFIDDISNVISTRKLPEMPDDIFLFGKRRCPINHPVVMFRKQAVEAADGYLHFPLMEDYYLWVRMMLKGSKIYNIPDSLLYFRSSHDMIKRRGGIKYAYTEIQFQRKLYGLGYIDLFTMTTNVCIRMVARIVPDNVRSYIYKYFLRR
jgi:glycosyltransferase involved in cell wall biosynthesis